jgi:hypothetical protein
MKRFRIVCALSLLTLPVGCSSQHEREAGHAAGKHEESSEDHDEDGDERENEESEAMEARSLVDGKSSMIAVSFAAAAGSLPSGWKVEGTRQDGPLATWKAIEDLSAPGSANVLALTSPNHASGSTFNLCWTNQVRFEDGALEVSIKPVSGKEDQGGGLIWRVKDKDDYYICRANPLEQNFRVYFVKDGTRHQLASASLPIPAGAWHTIRVEQVGDRIACSLDGKRLLEAQDSTIRGEGGIGLWTKSDAASEFAALRIAARTHDEGDERDEGEEHEHR